ncbi:hypothetical protein AB1Y20_007231 [Prymnesium parvum]|uniref:Vacuolar protein sorting-associated protein 51 homolog n=1 Tax=Prymnesium parvum TaxID=97485 RepID=A0AB34IWS6_PRYPA
MAAAGGGGVPPQRELTDALGRGDNPEALPTREPAATEETNEEAKSEEEMNDGQSTPRTEPPLAREGETPLQYAKIRVLLRGVRRLSSSLRIVGHLELPLDTIFTRAVAHTERVYATELDSCAWESFKLLLPTIVEAQAILLEEELSRCRSVAQRRGGRACAVRFRCFDLSTLDPPVMHLTGSQQAEERLLQVLLRLMGAQHLWMMNTPAAVQATTCRCFASSLRALAMDIDASDAAAAPPKAEMPTPHNEAAAANQEDSASDSSFRAGGTGGAAAALGRREGGESSSGGNDGQAFSPLPRQGALAADFYADGFELLAEGELLLENRIRQLVCSLLRFHLHKVFDRGVGGLEVTEKGELQLRAPSARSASFPVSPVCSSWPVPKRPCEKKLSPRTLAKNSEGVPAPWKDVPSALGSPSSFGLRPAARERTRRLDSSPRC